MIEVNEINNGGDLDLLPGEVIPEVDEQHNKTSWLSVNQG